MADYIDHKGHFSLVKYVTDFNVKFPTLCKVIVRQISQYLSTEVNVELLFSQSEFLPGPWHSKMGNRYYKRLVLKKHCLGQIYCYEPEVMRVMMKM